MKPFFKILTLVLMLTLVVTALSVNAQAAEIVASGTCGPNTTWTIDSDGTLVISGTGETELFVQEPYWSSYWKTIKKVVIEDGVTSIVDKAFKGSTLLTDISIPESVTSIGEYAFYKCSSLTEIALPSSLTHLGDYAFQQSGLTEIAIPGSLPHIGKDAFSNTKLTKVTIPNGVTSIGENAFYGCRQLTELTIPYTMITVGESAFYDCYGLKTLTVEGPTTFEDTIFGGMCSLTTVRFLGDAPTLGYNSLCIDAATIYYPKGNATWTSTFRNSVPGTVTWVAEEPEGNTQFDIPGVSMRLGNTLGMYFWVPAQAIHDGDYAVVVKTQTKENAIVTDISLTIPQKQWLRSGDYWLIGYEGIAAKEMTETVSMVICSQDGTRISNESFTSVQAYAHKMLEDATTSDSLKTLLVDMLNYGAEAQKQFSWTTLPLANSNLTPAQQAWATQSIDATNLGGHILKGDGLASSSLTLESNILLNLIMTEDIASRDTLAKISYTDHNGNQIAYEIPGTEYVFFTRHTPYDYYYIPVDTLVAADLATVVSLDIYRDDQLISHSEYNIAAYCEDTLDILEPWQLTYTCEALVKYCQSALRYFS